MSLAEWAAMPEDEPGEIVDGVLWRKRCLNTCTS